MANGHMIAVEGTDKAGKHTQVMKIIEYLRGRGIDAETLDFPQYNAYFGRFVRDYLNGQYGSTRSLPAEYTMLPYALDRLQHMPKINSWLADGKWVVLDRYTYSNSFSVAKCPQEQWPQKIQFMEDLEFNQLGIIRPDYNIYLYVDPRISYNMRTQGLKAYQNGRPDIHESDYKLLYDVSRVYHKIASDNPKKWTIVDEMKPDGTRMSIDEVFAKLRPIIDTMISSGRAGIQPEQLTDEVLLRILGTNYHNVCVYNFETQHLLNKTYNGAPIYWNDDCTQKAQMLKGLVKCALPRFELVAMVTGQTTVKCYPGQATWGAQDIEVSKDGEYFVGNMILRNVSTGRLESLNPNKWFGVYGPDLSRLAPQLGAYEFLRRATDDLMFWKRMFYDIGR